MLARMPWELFVEWQAFDLLSPIGGPRGDWQAAAVAASIFNARLLGTGKEVPVADFLLKFGKAVEHTAKKSGGEPAKPAQTWQQQKAIAAMWVEYANAIEEADRKMRERKAKRRKK